MRFLVDAQLPPALARRIAALGHQAQHVADCGLADAPDDVRPFAGPSAPGGAEGRGGGQWQVSTAGGITPRWGPGGTKILYLAPDGTLMAAPITVTGATLEPGRPVALFRTRIVGGGTDLTAGANYDIARDGRLLINTVLDEATAPITLIQNWNPEAKQ